MVIMMKHSLEHVLKRARAAGSAVIVGAGKDGAALSELMKENGFDDILAFFDNSEFLEGKRIQGIEVKRPYKVEGMDCVYILAVKWRKSRKDLCGQLKDLGIDEQDILTYHAKRDPEYLEWLDEAHYQEELSDMYLEVFGREMDWEHPVSYNEKINWEKLNVHDSRRTRLADKLLARDWVRERIGGEHLTQLYGVWNDVDEIDLGALPDQFVLKMNNGSGRNIIVKDKAAMDRGEVFSQLERWKEINYAYVALEMHYKDIVPKIICEEYLEGMAESLYDYNIYCFHGKPEYIWCIKGSHRPGCRASFYTEDWVMQPFNYGYPKDHDPAPRPERLDEMLRLSTILCKDFDHVRVDWYDLPDGRVLFGEMTFSTWGGLNRFEPDGYDAVMGSLI